MEFPPILVINLPTRNDRWKEIQESFQDWPPLQKLEAVKATPGWKGCNLSHVKALQIAKEKGWPWVLVLEDDAHPTQSSLTQFKQLLPSLWEQRHTWDVFLGGCTSITDASIRQHSPPLLNVKGHTTHFCLYSQDAYESLQEGIQQADVPIDEYFRRTPSVRTICTVPHLAVQRKSKSDIENSEADYTDLFQNSNAKLLEVADRQLEGFLETTRQFHTRILVSDILVLGVLATLWLLTPP